MLSVVQFDKNTYNRLPCMKRKPQGARSLNGIAINQRRLMRDLNAIGRIGIGDRGAVTRLVFSMNSINSAAATSASLRISMGVVPE